ncbi:MAG: hypothetical protein FWG10_10800 [Eubacteriaceae bacterium]|nr:hypothetical protein [Eubacteriaceae bacterium]
MKKKHSSDDIFKNLEAYKDLYDLVYAVLILGEQRNYIIDNTLIELGATFGFLKNNSGKEAIANKIFEVGMANYFISKETRNNLDKQITGTLQYDIAKN